MGLEEKLEKVVARHDELAQLMSAGDVEPARYTLMAKEYAELSPVVGKVGEFKGRARRSAIWPTSWPPRQTPR